MMDGSLREESGDRATGSYAFLASLSGNWSDSENPFVQFRKKIKARSGSAVWVAEIEDPLNKPNDGNGLKVVDACIHSLRKASLVLIVLLGDRCNARKSGTPIAIGQQEALVSYFEIEVFQAALSNIPLVVLESSDFTPGDRLEEFLRILRQSDVVLEWWRGITAGEGLEVSAEEVINNRDVYLSRQKIKTGGAAAALASKLIQARANLKSARHGIGDRLWLNGHQVTSPGNLNPSLARARHFLDIGRENNRHPERLSRVYLALSELMALSRSMDNDVDFLLLWQEALGLWSSSASWYGLHNHLGAGVIGALWSQKAAIDRLVLVEKDAAPPPPFGAMASAYFSLAKMCPLHSPKRYKTIAAGIGLANRAISVKGDADPGIYAVRGSLMFATYRVFNGMSDFRRFHDLAIRNGDAFMVAESHVYLGKGYSIRRQRKQAKYHLLEATSLLRELVKGGAPVEEFLVKALKHLGELQYRIGKRTESANTLEEALRLSEDQGIDDQLRQISAAVARQHKK